MSMDAITTPEEIREEKEDLLEGELGRNEGMIFEETRHTSLLHMIDKNMVMFTTKISKKERDKILRMLTFVRMYKLEMSDAMQKNPFVKTAVLKNCNLYLEQIQDFFKLQKSVDGWTAKEIFSILKAEEKAASKWGFSFGKKQDPEMES